jgi:hypothetical protein
MRVQGFTGLNKRPENADTGGNMFSGELISLLKQVISSWQVIAVSGALVLYLFLVSYVARTYKRPRGPSLVRRTKRDAPLPVGEPDLETSDNDDLGLVEEQN